MAEYKADIPTGYKNVYWVGEVGTKIRVRYFLKREGLKPRPKTKKFDRPVDPKTGKLTTDAVYKKMARDFQIAKQKEADENDNPAVGLYDPSVTLMEYLWYWRDHDQKPKRQITWAGYETHIKFIATRDADGTLTAKDPLATVLLDEVARKPALLEDMVGRLKQKIDLKTNKPISALTVRHHLRTYNIAMNKALLWNRITRNPFGTGSASVIGDPVHKKRNRDEVTPDLISEIQKIAQGHELEVGLKLVIATGFQRSELFGLRWVDIRGLDEGRAVCSVYRSVTQITGDSHHVEPPKNPYREGLRVGLGKNMTAWLKEYKKIKKENVLHQWDEEKEILSDIFGQPYLPQRLTRAMQEWRVQLDSKFAPFNEVKAEEGGLSLKALRHAFSTFLRLGGLDDIVIRDAMGHYDISTTQEHYDNVDPKHLEKIGDTLDKVIPFEKVS